MANDLLKFRDFLTDNQAGLKDLFSAASSMIENLKPTAESQNTTVRVLLNDDPVTVRALLDAHNIAGVAGTHGITVEKVMETLGQVLGVVTLVSALV